jgi:hypothetical protein
MGCFGKSVRVKWRPIMNLSCHRASLWRIASWRDFRDDGAAQASDSVLTTASIERKWINNWSIAATFEDELSNVTSSYAGKGVVRYARVSSATPGSRRLRSCRCRSGVSPPPQASRSMAASPLLHPSFETRARARSSG